MAGLTPSPVQFKAKTTCRPRREAAAHQSSATQRDVGSWPKFCSVGFREKPVSSVLRLLVTCRRPSSTHSALLMSLAVQSVEWSFLSMTRSGKAGHSRPWGISMWRQAVRSFVGAGQGSRLREELFPTRYVAADSAPLPILGAPGRLPGFPALPDRGRSWRMPPVRMGRRSSKIATRKNAQDAKRSKMYGKLGKQIVSAVKKGGPNPGTNALLAAALAFARQIEAPKEIVERNIKKAQEKGQADFTEIVYEVYGLGGVGIVVEALSDNNARAAASVRDVVKKGGAKMADPGSVLFNFRRCGVVAVPEDAVDGDVLLGAAMDAGADDVLEPKPGSEEEGQRSVFKVVCAPESYAHVRSAMEASGFAVDSDQSGLELLPLNQVDPDEDARELNEALIERLLELDDVDAVYSNQSAGQ